MKINGKTFVVTGGASGLGEAFVRRVVKEGGNVAIFDFNAERGESLVKELGDKQAVFAEVDVTETGSIEAGLSATVERFGAIHGLLNCAGTGMPRKVISRRGKVHSIEGFDQVIQINLVGTFNLLRLVASQMSKQEPDEDGERGIIINVASVAAFEGQQGQAAYSASKGGVVSMSLPIARELADHGIRVNSIAPGLFMTPMMASLPAPAKQALLKNVPFPRRLGHPSEFADLALHMVTNRYFNGTVVRLDGAIRMSKL